jgi:hypothetical protein
MTGISNWTLARRSVAFYFRSHLGTILGAAIATAVLTGALLVGDSVRAASGRWPWRALEKSTRGDGFRRSLVPE